MLQHSLISRFFKDILPPRRAGPAANNGKYHPNKMKQAKQPVLKRIPAEWLVMGWIVFVFGVAIFMIAHIIGVDGAKYLYQVGDESSSPVIELLAPESQKHHDESIKPKFLYPDESSPNYSPAARLVEF